MATSLLSGAPLALGCLASTQTLASLSMSCTAELLPADILSYSMRAARFAVALRSLNRGGTRVGALNRLDLPMTSTLSSSSSSTSPNPTSASSTPTLTSASPVASLPIDDASSYQFGPHLRLSGRQLFFLTPLSLASVNLSPVVPGHALVCTRRVVARVADMTPAEVSDCFLLAQLVGRMMTEWLRAESLSIAVQDGAAAGQSVPHVHVHVMPRRKGDFQRSDDIYGEMEQPAHSLAHDSSGGSGVKPHMDAKPDQDGENRKHRTLEEMAAEASLWRQYMQELVRSDHDKQHT